jgi:hypothetical protein
MLDLDLTDVQSAQETLARLRADPALKAVRAEQIEKLAQAVGHARRQFVERVQLARELDARLDKTLAETRQKRRDAESTSARCALRVRGCARTLADARTQADELAAAARKAFEKKDQKALTQARTQLIELKAFDGNVMRLRPEVQQLPKEHPDLDREQRAEVQWMLDDLERVEDVPAAIGRLVKETMALGQVPAKKPARPALAMAEAQKLLKTFGLPDDGARAARRRRRSWPTTRSRRGPAARQALRRQGVGPEGASRRGAQALVRQVDGDDRPLIRRPGRAPLKASRSARTTRAPAALVEEQHLDDVRARECRRSGSRCCRQPRSTSSTVKSMWSNTSKPLLHVGAQCRLALHRAARVMAEARHQRRVEDDVVGVEVEHAIEVLRLERGDPALHVVGRLLHRQHRRLLWAGLRRLGSGSSVAEVCHAQFLDSGTPRKPTGMRLAENYSHAGRKVMATTSVWSGTAAPGRWTALEHDVTADVRGRRWRDHGRHHRLLAGTAPVVRWSCSMPARSAATRGIPPATSNETVSGGLHAIEKKWSAEVAGSVLQSRREAVATIESHVQALGIDCGFPALPDALVRRRSRRTGRDPNGIRCRARAGLPVRLDDNLPDGPPAAHGPCSCWNSRPSSIRSPTCVPWRPTPAPPDAASSNGPPSSMSTPPRAGSERRTRPWTAREIVLANPSPCGFHVTQAGMIPNREYGLAAAARRQGLTRRASTGRMAASALSCAACRRGRRTSSSASARSTRPASMDALAAMAALEDAARRRLGVEAIAYRWSAQNFRSPDLLPYIGKDVSGAYIATGFATDGLVYGTLAASIVSDDLLGRCQSLGRAVPGQPRCPVKAAKGTAAETASVLKVVVQDT